MRIDKYKHKETGFTLVELLVVIIIIGILAAIAVPIYLNQQKTARDSSLTSDLKNAGTSIQTSLADHENWTKIKTIANASLTNNVGIFVQNNSDQPAIPTSGRWWNDYPALSKISVSEGTFLEIVNYQFDFCIAGMNKKGNYNYTRGAGNPLLYTDMLYYDVKLGGVVTLERIAKAVKDGVDSSCYGYGVRYLDVGGTI